MGVQARKNARPSIIPEMWITLKSRARRATASAAMRRGRPSSGSRCGAAAPQDRRCAGCGGPTSARTTDDGVRTLRSNASRTRARGRGPGKSARPPGSQFVAATAALTRVAVDRERQASPSPSPRDRGHARRLRCIACRGKCHHRSVRPFGGEPFTPHFVNRVSRTSATISTFCEELDIAGAAYSFTQALAGGRKPRTGAVRVHRGAPLGAVDRTTGTHDGGVAGLDVGSKAVPE